MLWINYKKPEGRAIYGKNVPRGTLLWNRNSQNIVHVDNYFWRAGRWGVDKMPGDRSKPVKTGESRHMIVA